MSVNFNAEYIFVLDGLTADDHGYTNPDYNKDDVFCVDADSNVYAYTMPKDHARDPATWPFYEEGKGVPLFRNYWTFLFNNNEAQGPYYQAIIDAPKTIIRPPVGVNDF